MKKKYSLLLALLGSLFVTGQNLVQNPSFENGLNNWVGGYVSSYTLPALITTDAHSGTNSVAYVNSPETLNGFMQVIPVTPGVTYRVSFWYKSYNTVDTTDTSNVRIYSRYLTATGGIVYQNNNVLSLLNDPLRGPNGGYLTDSQTWVPYSVDVVAPANVANLQFAIRMYQNGTAYFDDFLLQDVTTLAVTETKFLSKSVKMNTSVQNELKLFLPERCTVNIYSMEGKLMTSERVNNGGTIDTSFFARGMYIVEVNNGTEKFTQKIVKN